MGWGFHTSDTLELEVVVSHLVSGLGIELGSSGRAARVLIAKPSLHHRPALPRGDFKADRPCFPCGTLVSDSREVQQADLSLRGKDKEE